MPAEAGSVLVPRAEWFEGPSPSACDLLNQTRGHPITDFRKGRELQVLSRGSLPVSLAGGQLL